MAAHNWIIWCAVFRAARPEDRRSFAPLLPRKKGAHTQADSVSGFLGLTLRRTRTKRRHRYGGITEQNEALPVQGGEPEPGQDFADGCVAVGQVLVKISPLAVQYADACAIVRKCEANWLLVIQIGGKGGDNVMAETLPGLRYAQGPVEGWLDVTVDGPDGPLAAQ